MAESVRTPSRASKKRVNSWLIFFLPVAVSAGLMLSLGVAFLWRQSAQKSFSRAESTRFIRNAPAHGAPAEAETSASDRLPSVVARTELTPRGEGRAVDESASYASPRRLDDQQDPHSGSDEQVDWEVEMADSEELEPTAAMIEQERQKIRDGKLSLGFAGRPAERMAESLKQRVLARRAELRAQDADRMPVGVESEAPGVPGTAGAGPG
jgi:hypothetical protein